MCPWVSSISSGKETVANQQISHEVVAQQFGQQVLDISKTPALLLDLENLASNEIKTLLHPTKYKDRILCDQSALAKSLSDRVGLVENVSPSRDKLVTRTGDEVKVKNHERSEARKKLEAHGTVELNQTLQKNRQVSQVIYDDKQPDHIDSKILAFEKASQKLIESRIIARSAVLLAKSATGEWRNTDGLKDAFTAQTTDSMRRMVVQMQNAYRHYEGAGDLFEDLLTEYNLGDPKNVRMLNEDPKAPVIRTANALLARDILVMMNGNAQDTRRIASILQEIYSKQIAAVQSLGKTPDDLIQLKVLSKKQGHVFKAKQSLQNMPLNSIN